LVVDLQDQISNALPAAETVPFWFKKNKKGFAAFEPFFGPSGCAPPHWDADRLPERIFPERCRNHQKRGGRNQDRQYRCVAPIAPGYLKPAIMFLASRSLHPQAGYRLICCGATVEFFHFDSGMNHQRLHRAKSFIRVRNGKTVTKFKIRD
jgi:hypothetical protein